MSSNPTDTEFLDNGAAAQPSSSKPKKAKKPRAKKEANGGKPRSRLWVWVSNILALGVWAAVAAGVVLVYLALNLPPIDANALTRRPNIVIQDSAGAELGSFGDNYGDTVALTDLPKHLPAAVVAVEDRRFYDHFGIDLRGLARAMLTNIQAKGVVQGGSTITQQVAKNLFLTPERTTTRKLREMMLALWLERNFTKDEILTIYLNRVYLGAGTYGVEAASQRYFARSAKDVGIYQSAVLAGLLKAPSRYNPTNNTDLAKQRAEIVLKTMVETGALSETQAKGARQNATLILKNAAATKNTLRARFFSDWVLSQIESFVGTVDRDLVVRTTLRAPIQAAAEAALARQLEISGLAQNIGEGAVLSLSPDGAVRAMVGGRDYADSQFNRVTQALRQPGSAFKPFVYLAALDAGYAPDDLVTDGPINIAGWKPQNFSGKYLGPVSVQDALAESINTVAVRLAQATGPKAVVTTAQRLGITSDMKPELSLALGSAEVTLLELTAAYAPLANGGLAILPYAITAITDRDGVVLYQRQGDELGRVIAPGRVATMNRMMRGVIEHGTGTAATFGFPAAGKTGTSSDFRDAWFVGYSAELVTGVWVGNDDGGFMKAVTGGGVPARVWHDVMASAHKDHQPIDLPGLEDDGNLFAKFWQAVVGD
ncbi:MAG: PBP1A family penicillin-binding protein [Alphaproteobacteria bacterium]|nr:PBP1A family penicillin-binding protein [Alphaproteobacteria bacterium]PHY01335.1 MAG: penicillin-binding protein [Rhodospirillaceae bacterium]